MSTYVVKVYNGNDELIDQAELIAYTDQQAETLAPYFANHPDKSYWTLELEQEDYGYAEPDWDTPHRDRE